MDSTAWTTQSRLDGAALDVAAERAARAVGVQGGEVIRFDGSDVSIAGAWAGPGTPPLPDEMREHCMPLHRGGVHATVLRTGRPARIADYATRTDDTSQMLASLGTRSAAAAPIVVDGVIWGSLGVSSDCPGALRKRSEAALALIAGELGRELSTHSATGPVSVPSRVAALVGWRRPRATA